MVTSHNDIKNKPDTISLIRNVRTCIPEDYKPLNLIQFSIMIKTTSHQSSVNKTARGVAKIFIIKYVTTTTTTNL